MSDDEDEPKFQDEFAAYSRAGPAGLLNTLLNVETLEKLSKPRGGFQLFPPEDQFLLNVNKFCRDLMDQDVKLMQVDIDRMLEYSQDIKESLRYRNAAGYILGYIATKGGTVINPASIQKTINEVLPKLGSDQGVFPPDVVRYARYWMKLRSKVL